MSYVGITEPFQRFGNLKGLREKLRVGKLAVDRGAMDEVDEDILYTKAREQEFMQRMEDLQRRLSGAPPSQPTGMPEFGTGDYLSIALSGLLGGRVDQGINSRMAARDQERQVDFGNRYRAYEADQDRLRRQEALTARGLERAQGRTDRLEDLRRQMGMNSAEQLAEFDRDTLTQQYALGDKMRGEVREDTEQKRREQMQRELVSLKHEQDLELAGIELESKWKTMNEQERRNAVKSALDALENPRSENHVTASIAVLRKNGYQPDPEMVKDWLAIGKRNRTMAEEKHSAEVNYTKSRSANQSRLASGKGPSPMPGNTKRLLITELSELRKYRDSVRKSGQDTSGIDARIKEISEALDDGNKPFNPFGGKADVKGLVNPWLHDPRIREALKKKPVTTPKTPQKGKQTAKKTNSIGGWTFEIEK